MRLRLPRPFTIYSVGLFGAAAGISVALLALGQQPPLTHILVLGCLFAIAENTGVEFAEKSAISAGLMFIVASIVLFRNSAPELGPLLVGLFGGLYFEHFRDRDLLKVLFNSANFGLAAFIAACVFNVIVVDSPTLPFLLVASIPVVLVESTANWLIVVPAVAMFSKRSMAEVGRDAWVTEFQVVPFGFLGVVLGGLYLSLGGWVLPLFVAPIFIARQACASYLSLRDARDAALSTLVRALEAKDQYTAGHVERVARFAVETGKELEFRHSQLERLRYAALMHDIGKLIIPNHILNKPGRLTEAEYELMRHHEHVTVELLRRIEFLAPVVPSIEADQGSFVTFPDAPLETRILAVADAFDAMTSTRAYRRALTQEVAFSELRDKSGSQFDGECVEALIRAIEQRGECHGAGFEENVAEFKAPPPVAGTGSAGLGDLAKDGEEVRR
jgi:hypothetical protein